MEDVNNKKRILLIEDEEYIGELYKRQLEINGFSTDLCVTGEQGLAAYKSNHYDMILLDILLPDIKGLDILKNIKKKNDKGKPPIIILLSNISKDKIIKEGLSLGADGYLIKAQCTPTQIVNEVKFFFRE